MSFLTGQASHGKKGREKKHLRSWRTFALRFSKGGREKSSFQKRQCTRLYSTLHKGLVFRAQLYALVYTTCAITDWVILYSKPASYGKTWSSERAVCSGERVSMWQLPVEPELTEAERRNRERDLLAKLDESSSSTFSTWFCFVSSSPIYVFYRAMYIYTHVRTYAVALLVHTCFEATS